MRYSKERKDAVLKKLLPPHSRTIVERQPDGDRSILSAMKIATGKVVGGKVVLEGASFEEGSSVTVLARDEEGGITLAPGEEVELLLAIAEADRGQLASAEEVLAKLARRHG